MNSLIKKYSHKIDRSNLQPGDHIYAYRNLHFYSHQGIYVGDDRVIHYTRTEETGVSKPKCKICGYQENVQRGVVKSCIDCFLGGHQLRRFHYNASVVRFSLVKRVGTCSMGDCDPPEEVVKRATAMMNDENGFGNYDIRKNNCENFATYCKTGVSVSRQIFSVQNTISAIFNPFSKHTLDKLRFESNVVVGKVEES